MYVFQFAYSSNKDAPSTSSLKMKAEWNGAIIAESDDIVKVDGNAYFPISSLNKDYIKPSDTKTVCSWKGVT
jgi:uncharacterized protein (DUF427 family)